MPSVLFLYTSTSGAPSAAPMCSAAAWAIRSPAASHTMASRGEAVSGEEYSGWAWSTYQRAPLGSTVDSSRWTGSPSGPTRAWSVSCEGWAAERGMRQPRASTRGDSPV